MKRAKLLASAIPVLMLSAMPAAHAGGLCDNPFFAWLLPQCEQPQPPRGGEGSGGVSVPEPATLALLTFGIGGAGVAAFRRRRKAGK